MLTVFWLENLKGRDDLEDKGIDGKIILDWIFGRKDGRLWTGFIWLSIVGSSEHGFHKRWEFLD
jgi:hypothetical protein